MTKEEKKKNTALVVQPRSAEVLIGQAIDKGVSVEVMERLFELDKRWRADRARETYFDSLAKFQMECPVIKKKTPGGKTNTGVVAYYYAPLGTIVEQTKVIIAKNGFSYVIKASTGTEKEKFVTDECIVTHIAGHAESSEITVPLGVKTNVMSDSQVVMSAMTFAKRYAFCNAFGILTADDDKDGVIAGDTTKGKKVATTPAEAYDKVVKMLSNSTNKEVLFNYKEKLEETGCGFSKEKAKELQKIISQKVDELDNK